MEGLAVAIIAILAGLYVQFSQRHPKKFRRLDRAAFAAFTFVYCAALAWNYSARFSYVQAKPFLSVGAHDAAWTAINSLRLDDNMLTGFGFVAVTFLIGVSLFHQLIK